MNEVFLEEIELDKTSCFDWYSFTISSLGVSIHADKWSINEIGKFNELLSLLKIFDKSTITDTYGKNGYAVGMQLYEGCFIYYGGEFAKNQFNEYTLMVDMSGRGCRNFENRGGNWAHLFKWCQLNNYTAGRLDQAIDDYTGKEIDLSTVFDIIHNHKSYSSLPRKANCMISWEKSSTDSLSTGFTINLGNKSSKCSLCIYDKLSEQRSKNIIEKVSYHVRFELRFRKEMASKAIDKYLLNYDNNPQTFLKYVSSCLYSTLDLKEITPQKRITDRFTHPSWLKFLGSVDKIDLHSTSKTPTTLAQKEIWFRQDLPATLLELVMTKGDDLMKFINEVMIDKLHKGKIPDKTLHRINAFFNKEYGVIDAFNTSSLTKFLNDKIIQQKMKN